MFRIMVVVLATLSPAAGQGIASRSIKPTPSPRASGRTWNSTLTNISRQAGLTAPTVYGAESGVQYLSETSSGGIAFLDYDDDGWLDIFVVSGTRFGETPAGASNRLYPNNHDGTFSDATQKAGLEHTGWGQGVAVADVDNDGKLDLIVTYWGETGLYRNNGNGTFSDVTAKAEIATKTRQSYP